MILFHCSVGLAAQGLKNLAGIAALPLLTQDGLADEEVTLNRVDSAQTATDNPERIVSEQRSYEPPPARDDGLTIGSFRDTSINISHIEILLKKTSQGEFGSINSLLISHQGELLLEDYWGKGEIDTPHYVFSITKNMISNAVGKAIELGYIDIVDDKIIRYLPEVGGVELAPGADQIKIRDLLTMRSGLSFDKDDLKDLEVTRENHVIRHGSKTPLFSEHFLSCQEQDRKC